MAGPVMRFRSGAISATVWEHRRSDGVIYPSVKLVRSYRDSKTREWKETSDFTVNDLPVVAILARKAFEALALDHAACGHPEPSEEPDPAEEQEVVEKPARRGKSPGTGKGAR